ATSLSVEALRSAALRPAGSTPLATAARAFRARIRASSGVSFPTAHSVNRRVGAPRPEPARYFTTKDLAPDDRTRNAKPMSLLSQTKYSSPLVFRPATSRFVILTLCMADSPLLGTTGEPPNRKSR